jgi:hypothetical protein
MRSERETAKASRGADVVDTRFGVIGDFPDGASARGAIEALGRAGIETHRVSLEGRGADRAAAPPAVPASNARADARIIKRWLRQVVPAAAIGAALGAVFGVLAGVVAMQLIDPDITLGSVVTSAFLGALAFSAIAVLVTGVANQGAGEAWATTFSEARASGQMSVAVYLDEKDELELARQILEESGAGSVRRTGDSSAGAALRTRG